MRWRYSGNPLDRFKSSITDFVFTHDMDCPDLPFASADADYPAGSLTGAGPDHASFNRMGSADDRLKSVTTPPDLPYSVEWTC
jgi:hypothetical protein